MAGFLDRGRVGFLAVVAGTVAVAASCGARTPLISPEASDAGVTPVVDAAIEDVAVEDAPNDAPVPCVPGRFTFELATAQLMFVIDRSGSMALGLDGQQPRLQPSRWRVLENGLQQTLPPFDQQIAMGAKFYPEVVTSGGASAECRTDPGVGIAPKRGNAQPILGTFTTTSPGGGTPTAEAVRLAADYLATTRTVARTLVVATDGAPNCDGNLDRKTCTCTVQPATGCTQPPDGSFNCLDDARTVSVITDIFTNRKIPVYVVGIGGTESSDYVNTLNSMAVAGGRPRAGTPKYFDVQTPAEMTAALTTIRDTVAKCTFLTPSAPTDPNAIAVEVNGVSVPRDPTHTNGWDWVDQAYGALEFFGAACTNAGSGTAVTGVVGCSDK